MPTPEEEAALAAKQAAEAAAQAAKEAEANAARVAAEAAAKAKADAAAAKKAEKEAKAKADKEAKEAKKAVATALIQNGRNRFKSLLTANAPSLPLARRTSQAETADRAPP